MLFNSHIGYHLEAVLFDLILVFLFFEIFFNNKRNTKNFILFGLFSGIAFIISESSIVLLIPMFILWFIEDHKFILRKDFFKYSISAIISLTPIIIYNLTHHFSNIKHLFYGTIIHKIVCRYELLKEPFVYCLDALPESKSNLLNFFIESLPKFFGYSHFSLIYYTIFILAIVYIIKNNFKSIKDNLKLIIKNKFKICNIKKELFILIFVLFYTLIYFLKGQDKIRYLFPLYIYIPLLISIAISYFSEKINQKKLKNIFLITIISLLLIISVTENLKLINPTDEIKQYNSLSTTEKVPEIVDFLNKNNIKYFYSDLFLRWQIVFESNEKIIGSCENMCYCGGEGRISKYPLYEKEVNKSKDYAIILRQDSEIHKKMESFLNKNKYITFKKEIIKDKLIYYSFSKEIRPKEIMTNCTTNEYIFPKKTD
jgi:hypothetical protein